MPTETYYRLHQLFSRLSVLSSPSLSDFFPPNSFSSTSTPFTTITSSTTADPRATRPALLVSATSWTADEDFSLLLSALSIYDKAVTDLASRPGRDSEQEDDSAQGAKNPSRLPKVLVVITGKGAGKAAFEAQVREKEQAGGWEHVRVRTAWLAIEDYPKLLGKCAMEDIRMPLSFYGCRLGRPGDLAPREHVRRRPADEGGGHVRMWLARLRTRLSLVRLPSSLLIESELTRTPSSINELVTDGVNGTVFRSAEELAGQLVVRPMFRRAVFFFCSLSVWSDPFTPVPVDDVKTGGHEGQHPGL